MWEDRANFGASGSELNGLIWTSSSRWWSRIAPGFHHLQVRWNPPALGRSLHLRSQGEPIRRRTGSRTLALSGHLMVDARHQLFDRTRCAATKILAVVVGSIFGHLPALVSRVISSPRQDHSITNSHISPTLSAERSLDWVKRN